jgi:actin cytoskeleton-regulatory complex protein PAN1
MASDDRETQRAKPQSKPLADSNVKGDMGDNRSTSTSEVPSSRPQAPTSKSTGSYASYKSAEERAAFIKQQAEQRMAERLAALGLKAPAKLGETASQRQEREQKEKETRLREADAEDARRERERQRRLEDEQITPPAAVKSVGKKPPPPPSRKSRNETTRNDEKQAEAESKRVDTQIAAQALQEQQEAQEAERERLE